MLLLRLNPPVLPHYGQYYVHNTPAKASYTITLSGECSGKITKTVTGVSYYYEYDYTGNAVDKDTPYSEVNFYTNDNGIYSYGYTYASVPGDKFSVAIKNGKASLKLQVKSGYAYPYFYSLADGAYDSQITCKGDQTLSQLLMGSDPYINYDAPSFKSMASVTHSNSTDEPGTGEYKAKFSASGEIELPGQCTIKGELLTATYSLVCTAPKAVKIKVAASSEGTSLINL